MADGPDDDGKKRRKEDMWSKQGVGFLLWMRTDHHIPRGKKTGGSGLGQTTVGRTKHPNKDGRTGVKGGQLLWRKSKKEAGEVPGTWCSTPLTMVNVGGKDLGGGG